MLVSFKGFKSIKNTLKIAGRICVHLVELIMAIALFCFFAIQVPFVVNKTVDWTVDYLSDRLNTSVKIDRLGYDIIDGIYCENIYVEDFLRDTLIYSEILAVNIGNIDLDKLDFEVKSIFLSGSTVKLQQYKGSDDLNLEFILDAFGDDNQDSSASDFKLHLDQLALENVRFLYHDHNEDTAEFGIDYQFIDASNIWLNAANLKLDGDGVVGQIQSLSCIEKSGFKLEDFKGLAKVSSTQIRVENLRIKTPQSIIANDYVELNFERFGDFLEYNDKVVMKSDILESHLALSDLAFFAPVFQRSTAMALVFGHVDGTVNDFYATDLNLTVENYLKLNGDVVWKNVVDFWNSEFIGTLKESSLSAEALSSLKVPFLDSLIDQGLISYLAPLGKITIEGMVAGTPKDLVVGADVSSNIGAACTYLNFHSVHDIVHYEGELACQELNLGLLLGQDVFGKTFNSLQIKGKGFDIENLEITMAGTIDYLEANGYRYEDILLDATMANKIFDGYVQVNDENLAANYHGRIDFTGRKPIMNFDLIVNNAYLKALHILERDEDETLCGIFKVSGEGLGIDEFDGTVEFHELYYVKGQQEYEIHDFVLTSEWLAQEHRKINLHSDPLDAEIEGQVWFNSLPTDFHGLLSSIVPSMVGDGYYGTVGQEFDFALDIKDFSFFSNVVDPNIKIANGTLVNGQFNSHMGKLKLDIQSDSVTLWDRTLHQIDMKSDEFVGAMITTVSAQRIEIANGAFLDNTKLLLDAYQDNIGGSFSWVEGEDTSLIAGQGFWKTQSEFDFDLASSSHFYLNGDRWDMDSTHIAVDSGLVQSDTLRMIKFGTSSSLAVLSSFGSQGGNEVGVAMENLFITDIAKVLNLNEAEDYHGVVVGNAKMHIAESSDFRCEGLINIYSVGYQGYVLGDVAVRSEYSTKDKTLQVDGNLTKNGTQELTIGGGIGLHGDNALDVSINIPGTNLANIEPLIPDGFSELSGLVSGALTVGGIMASPEIQGEIVAHNTNIKVDFLNTVYQVLGEVPIKVEKDAIFVDRVPITDANGVVSLMNGSIFHTQFQDLSYDFSLEMDRPFLCLNTEYEHNPLYYGTALVTGGTDISYDKVNDLVIEVYARTEKGTNITLPLYGATEVKLEEFVKFINTSDTEEEYEVDLDGISMNFKLDVTNDTEINLVFDDLVGDQIYCVGTGNLTLDIDRYNHFNMYGVYEVDDGHYTFTLNDIISKKFRLAEGGTIAWYGDPYNADINLQAIYDVKASIYSIMPESDRDRYKRKTMVECQLNLTDNLFNPELNFGINLPRSDEDARAALRSLIETEQELNRQVFALLLFNQFIPRVSAENGANLATILTESTREAISNQLGNWLSNFNDKLEVGLNYEFEDEQSNREMAVELTTQLFNDKVTVNGNFGYSTGNEINNNPNSIIGDVNIEYRLNQEGSFRVRAFNRSNEYDAINEQGRYTQGVGLFYRTEYYKFSEFWEGVKSRFSRSKD